MKKNISYGKPRETEAYQTCIAQFKYSSKKPVNPAKSV